MKETEKAWLAGIIDGKGSIVGNYSMKTDKSRHHTGKVWRYPAFTFQIQVADNNIATIDEVIRITGIPCRPVVCPYQIHCC